MGKDSRSPISIEKNPDHWAIIAHYRIVVVSRLSRTALYHTPYGKLVIAGYYTLECDWYLYGSFL